MTRETIISDTLRKARLPSHDEEWARRLIGMSLNYIKNCRGDIVDFTGASNVLAAVIEAREAIAKAGLGA